EREQCRIMFIPMHTRGVAYVAACGDVLIGRVRHRPPRCWYRIIADRPVSGLSSELVAAHRHRPSHLRSTGTWSSDRDPDGSHDVRCDSTTVAGAAPE